MRYLMKALIKRLCRDLPPAHNFMDGLVCAELVK